eukprot:526841-Pelagomonas_calceolata.AAC.1
MGSSSTPARHIHLIRIKYCEDTRPGAQLEASQQQHKELCKQLQGVERRKGVDAVAHSNKQVWLEILATDRYDADSGESA